MPHECQIYVLFDENGIVNYVGRSARPLNLRMNEHRKVLGFTPRYRVIDRCSTDCRNVEKKWIDYYREQGYKLRNINYGQGPHFLPESSRKKLSLAFKGRPCTWGHKISEAEKGRPKNWTPEARKRVESSQFKKGHSNWDSLTPEQQESIRQQTADRWKDPEFRKKMEPHMKRGSADRTEEERRVVREKTSKALLSHPKEERIARAKVGAEALLAKHPDQMSRNIKKFWEELRKDPERYADYLKRRGEMIAEAKARKKSGS